jgi:protease II
MMGKSCMALLVLLTVSVLALYVSAQVQPEAETRQYQKAREAYENLISKYQHSDGSYDAQNGVNVPVTLCTGPVMAKDGTAKCLYQALPANGKLRIEMQDGTIQEIDLRTVKLITMQ